MEYRTTRCSSTNKPLAVLLDLAARVASRRAAPRHASLVLAVDSRLDAAIASPPSIPSVTRRSRVRISAPHRRHDRERDRDRDALFDARSTVEWEISFPQQFARQLQPHASRPRALRLTPRVSRFAFRNSARGGTVPKREAPSHALYLQRRQSTRHSVNAFVRSIRRSDSFFLSFSISVTRVSSLQNYPETSVGTSWNKLGISHWKRFLRNEGPPPGVSLLRIEVRGKP